MKKPLNYLLLLSVAAILSGVTSNAHAVVKGLLLRPEQFPTVGCVKTNTGHGTGTLIAPNIVITAAHVLVGTRGDTPITNPSQIRFVLDGRNEVAKAVAFAIHEDFDRSVSRPDLDLALVLLDRPVLSAHLMHPIRTTPLSANQTFKVVGCGLDETGKLAMRRSGRLHFAGMLDRMVVMRVDPRKPQRSESGDSGGPLLRKDKTGWEIVGLVQGIKYDYADRLGLAEEYDGIDLTRYVSLSDHREWIEGKIRNLRSISIAEALPRFVPIPESREHPESIPLNAQQVTGLLRVDTSPTLVLNMIRERGMSEPIDEIVFQRWRDAGATPEFLRDVQNESIQPFSFRQLRALVKVDTSEPELSRLLRSRGLQGSIDRQRHAELLEAGATRSLLRTLTRVAG